MNNPKKSLQPIDIFRLFIKKSPYHIESSSIKSITRATGVKSDEPLMPNISCSLSEGAKLDFELVEIIDDKSAEALNRHEKVIEAISKKMETIDLLKRKKFQRLFKDFLIMIAFDANCPESRKPGIIPSIVEILLDRRRIINVPDVPVVSIEKDEGDYKGPVFDLEVINPLKNIPLIRIKKRFKYNFSTNNSLEMLAYFNLTSEVNSKIWLPSVQLYVKKFVKMSKFRRVWIFAVKSNEILYVYPPFNSR